MDTIERLKAEIEDVYADTDGNASARAFRSAAVLALEAYEETGRMAALSEARACLAKLARYVVSDVPQDASALAELLDG